MLKIFLWFVSKDKRFFQDAIKILERQHDGLKIVGAATGEEISNADEKFFDVILVVGAKNFGMSKIARAARQLHLPEEKLLGDRIVCIPGFTLEKYRQLQRSRLSIFSRNCFAGLISNKLGLPFRSPFINITIKDEDFVRFMRHPRVYMEEELIFSFKEYSDWDGYEIATFNCGNVPILMNHSPDFDEAVRKWNERKQKINWYNIFVTMMTNSPEVLEQFDALPHGKKICFVPFKSDLDSAFYVPPEITKILVPPEPKIEKEFLIWETVNQSVIQMKFFYDPFDMLLYGKKTPLF